MTTQPPTFVTCPRCRAEMEPIPIVYGYPTPEAFQLAEAGHLRLGGCMVEVESPEFVCPACDGALPFASALPRPRRRHTVTPMDMDGGT